MRNNDGGSVGLEELAMIFLVAEKTDVVRTRRIKRGHASQRQVELAPDDVTIDPTGELGKRECKCQLRSGQRCGESLFAVGRSGDDRNFRLGILRSREGTLRSVLVKRL